MKSYYHDTFRGFYICKMGKNNQLQSDNLICYPQFTFNFSYKNYKFHFKPFVLSFDTLPSTWYDLDMNVKKKDIFISYIDMSAKDIFLDCKNYYFIKNCVP